MKFNVPLHVSVGKDLATLMAKGFRNWSPPNYFKFKFPYNLMHWENYHNVFIWTCTRNLGGLQFIKTPYILHPTGWSFLLKPLCIYLVQNHFITSQHKILGEFLYDLVLRQLRGAPVRIVLPGVMFFPCELRFSDWSWRIINKPNNHRLLATWCSVLLFVLVTLCGLTTVMHHWARYPLCDN